MRKNLVGQKFNQLLVLEDSGLRSADGCIKWKCGYDCGNLTNVITTRLISGTTKSCGCLRSIRNSETHKKYNKFIFDNDICTGIDNKGLKFIIDINDYEKIKDICCNVSKVDKRVSGKAGKQQVRLHRYVLDITDDKLIIDHINHDPVDNRKCNLRIANKSQNGANRPKNKNNTSGYKGVTTLKNGRYMARIVVNYKGVYLGCFETPQEAHKAYKKAEMKYFGEYAYKGGENCE